MLIDVEVGRGRVTGRCDSVSLCPAGYYCTSGNTCALLLGNGLFMQRAEHALATGTPAWRRLHVTAVVSLVLWFAVLLASTFLTSAG